MLGAASSPKMTPRTTMKCPFPRRGGRSEVEPSTPNGLYSECLKGFIHSMVLLRSFACSRCQPLAWSRSSRCSRILTLLSLQVNLVAGRASASRLKLTRMDPRFKRERRSSTPSPSLSARCSNFDLPSQCHF